MKLTKKLLMFFMCFVAIFGLACISLNVNAGDEIYQSCIFTIANNESCGDYTSSWTNTTDSKQYTITNANNNSKKWDYIKIGRKSYESTGTIATKTAITESITKVTMTVDAVTTAKISYIKLFVSSNSDFSSSTEYSVTPNTGVLAFTITSAAANKYYKIEISCLAGSNGLIQISRVDFYHFVDKNSLDAPTSLAISNNVASFNSVEHATGYVVGLFASAEATEPAYTFATTTTSVELKDVPQNQQYYAKVKAVGDSSYDDSEYSASASAVAFTNTAISEYTPTYIKNTISNQDAAPWTYYKTTGVIKTINDAYSGLSIADSLEESTILYLNSIENYASYGFAVGNTVTVTGYKSNSKFNDVTIINHIQNYTGRFEALQTAARLSVDYSTSGVLGNGWVKVTNASTLKAGDQLIIGTAQKAMSTTQNTSNRAEADLYISSPSSSVQVLTLGGSEGAWTFYTGSGYLNAPCVDGKNNMTTEVFATEADITANAKWTVAIADGNATIVSTGGSENSRRTIMYNSSSKIFSCYGSGQTAVSLYRYEETEIIQYGIKKDGSENNQLAMQFGGIIEKGLYDVFAEDTNVEFGVLYCKSSDLGANTFASLIASVNNNDIEFDAMLTDNNIFKKNDIARINEAGDPDDEGSYYQFGVTISNISLANIVTEVTAVCYVKYNGTYYLMNQKAYSVKTIAAAYVDAKDTSAYSDHLGMLNWLKNYTVE